MLKLIAPLVILFGSIASLKVTRTVEFKLTPTAPFVGFTETTVGGVRSGASVLKLAVNTFVSSLPATSVTPAAPLATTTV